jgi:hypothetical protein
MFPPITILPALGISRPAIAGKVVVLPQPEGPSKVTCSPLSTRRSTASTVITEP